MDCAKFEVGKFYRINVLSGFSVVRVIARCIKVGVRKVSFEYFSKHSDGRLFIVKDGCRHCTSEDNGDYASSFDLWSTIPPFYAADTEVEKPSWWDERYEVSKGN